MCGKSQKYGAPVLYVGLIPFTLAATLPTCRHDQGSLWIWSMSGFIFLFSQILSVVLHHTSATLRDLFVTTFLRRENQRRR